MKISLKAWGFAMACHQLHILVLLKLAFFNQVSRIPSVSNSLNPDQAGI